MMIPHELDLYDRGDLLVPFPPCQQRRDERRGFILYYRCDKEGRGSLEMPSQIRNQS